MGPEEQTEQQSIHPISEKSKVWVRVKLNIFHTLWQYKISYKYKIKTKDIYFTWITHWNEWKQDNAKSQCGTTLNVYTLLTVLYNASPHKTGYEKKNWNIFKQQINKTDRWKYIYNGFKYDIVKRNMIYTEFVVCQEDGQKKLPFMKCSHDVTLCVG